MIYEIISKVFDVVINKVALPIAILCSVLLFSPKYILQEIEVLTIVNTYKGIIWIILLFSLLLYSYEKCKLVFHYIKQKIDIRKKNAEYMKQIVKDLDSLSWEEEAWIFYCLMHNKKTLIAIAPESTAVSLENKGIVTCPPKTDPLYS